MLISKVNTKSKIQNEEQVKQWSQENIFEEEKIDLEQTKTIADIILRSLERVQNIVTNSRINND